jgi:hypothetical protein
MGRRFEFASAVGRLWIGPSEFQYPSAEWELFEEPSFAWKSPQMFVRRSTGIAIPYWSLALVTGCSAALPWFTYRFSLRTLLIATTLVGVVLGLAVWALRK